MSIKLIPAKINFPLALLLLSLIWCGLFLGGGIVVDNALPPIKPSISDVRSSSLPNFSQFKNVKEKKQRFFDYLSPLIAVENAHLLSIRQVLETLILKRENTNLNKAERSWLKKLAVHYKENPEKADVQLLQQLLIKVDIIPSSLVLAQAAIESGWGTSRFAKVGNNLFGQWCFKKGCGIVPSQRAQKKVHEVAKFANVASSIRAYMKNLNSFPSYGIFRELRAKHRYDGDIPLSGLKLASGLLKYSEQGADYIVKVRSVISSNKLAQYDTAISH